MLKEILSGPDGTASTMRVMALLALLFGFILSLAVVALVWFGKEPSQVVILVGVFVGAAFGGKAYQAKVENNK